MTWALIDDEMAYHQKVWKAGNAAFGAWVRMLCWVRRKKTDGKVPTEIARSVASKREIEKLVDALLLDVTDDGFEIHDYLEHNLSAEELSERKTAQSEARSEKARRAATARWDVQRAQPRAPAEQARVAQRASNEHAPHDASAPKTHAPECPADPPIPPIPPSGSISEKYTPLIPPEEQSCSTATVTDRVLEELGRSPRTRNLATPEWASELVLLAGAVRADDLCAAIRKCVVGAPEGLAEGALKQRLVGFASKARSIEGVRRAKHEEAEKPKARPPGYIPLGVRYDIPIPPPDWARGAA